MTEPLQFDFTAYDQWSDMVEAFNAKHPGMRFVVLEIPDSEQLATLLRDMLEWPEHRLRTSGQENAVAGTVVSGMGEQQKGVVERFREQALIITRVRALATLLETTPGAGKH